MCDSHAGDVEKANIKLLFVRTKNGDSDGGKKNVKNEGRWKQVKNYVVRKKSWKFNA